MDRLKADRYIANQPNFLFFRHIPINTDSIEIYIINKNYKLIQKTKKNNIQRIK